MGFMGLAWQQPIGVLFYDMKALLGGPNYLTPV